MVDGRRAIQYDQHSMGLNGGVASASGYLLQGGAFLGHRTAHGTSISGGLTYGWEDDNTQRNVLYPNTSVISLGRLESSVVGAHLRVSHEYDRSTTAFTPYVDLSTTRINLMDDPEHGSAGFLTANITGHGDTFAAAQAGINIDPRAGIANSGFAPSLRLGMTQFLGNNQNDDYRNAARRSGGRAAIRATLAVRPHHLRYRTVALADNQRPGGTNVLRCSGDYHVSGRSQGLTASIQYRTALLTYFILSSDAAKPSSGSETVTVCFTSVVGLMTP